MEYAELFYFPVLIPGSLALFRVDMDMDAGIHQDSGSHEQPPTLPADAALKLRSHWSTGAAVA
jgi:hypothetical protein